MDYFYRQLRGDKGVLALRHWRDGHCGEDHPGTWGVLLKVIGDCIGPVPAGHLEKEVPTNNNWTLAVGCFGGCVHVLCMFSVLYLLQDTVPPADCHCFTGTTPSPVVSNGIPKFNVSLQLAYDGRCVFIQSCSSLALLSV